MRLLPLALSATFLAAALTAKAIAPNNGGTPVIGQTGSFTAYYDGLMDEVAIFYDAEAEVKLEQLTTLLEPIILVIMAAVILVILLAIYLPIIDTISSGPMGGRRPQ